MADKIVAFDGEMYFRVKVDGKWQNLPPRDIPWEELEPILKTKSPEWLLSMIEHMHARERGLV